MLNLNPVKLSVIIPCFNESQNVPELLKKLEKIRENVYEVILVDNGSTDYTHDILNKELNSQKYRFIKVLRVKKNIGYGNGIMMGVYAAKGEIIAWTHADLQTDPGDIIGAFDLYINTINYQNYILKGKRIGRNKVDTFFTWGMSILSSLILKVKLFDINAQPKMFHYSFLNKLKHPPDDFSLDLYFLYQATINNIKLIEFPVKFGTRIYGDAKGGGTFKGKWKLVKRTWSYMIKLKKEFDN